MQLIETINLRTGKRTYSIDGKRVSYRSFEVAGTNPRYRSDCLSTQSTETHVRHFTTRTLKPEYRGTKV